MIKCLHCRKETNNKKFCSISCQLKSQSKERKNKTYGEFKNFTVKCNKCGKEFIINEREKLFSQKEKYYCSRKCANSRVLSKETKGKISEKIKVE